MNQKTVCGNTFIINPLSYDGINIFCFTWASRVLWRSWTILSVSDLCSSSMMAHFLQRADNILSITLASPFIDLNSISICFLSSSSICILWVAPEIYVQLWYYFIIKNDVQHVHGYSLSQDYHHRAPNTILTEFITEDALVIEIPIYCSEICQAKLFSLGLIS